MTLFTEVPNRIWNRTIKNPFHNGQLGIEEERSSSMAQISQIVEPDKTWFRWSKGLGFNHAWEV